tara:strand:- start:140 stop:379 length:240 start_codon:yes stop_codon:yes gene_type:complete
MTWEIILKNANSIYRRAKEKYMIYWQYAQNLPGTGEVATLDWKVLNFINARLAENIPDEVIIDGVGKLAESYVMFGDSE